MVFEIKHHLLIAWQFLRPQLDNQYEHQSSLKQIFIKSFKKIDITVGENELNQNYFHKILEQEN